jgi:CubicO group peptidase (beta-lactamase class C family)
MKGFAAVFCIAGIVLLVGAQSKKWGLPDSSTGRAASAVLDAIEKGDDAAVRLFLKEFCTEDFRNAFPEAAHIRVFRQTHDEMGKFDVIGAKKAGPTEAEIVIRSQATGRRLRLRFQLESPDSARISSLMMEPVKEAKRFSSLEEFGAYLDKAAEENRFSGAVLVAKDGRPLLRKAYGMASKRYSAPNTVETKFNIGSINKIFTKVAVHQLVEKGKIGLDDRLGKYVQGFPEEISERVTVRHLLEHKSGMGHYWNEKYEARVARLRTVEDFLEIIRDEPLLFEPGTSDRYSNSGYTVLGAIVEKASGLDYYEYIRRHVCGPAGMTNSDHYELDGPVRDLATGYTNQNPDGSQGEGYERNTLYQALKGSPAGGGFSTLDDMLKFDLFLKEGKFFEDSESDAARMFRRMGGLGVAGGAPGCNAILESDWERGYTVVVLSNYDPPTAEELGLEIMALLREKNI